MSNLNCVGLNQTAECVTGGLWREYRFAKEARRARWHVNDEEKTMEAIADWLSITSHSKENMRTLRSLYCRNASEIMYANLWNEQKRFWVAVAHREPQAIAMAAAIILSVGVLACLAIGSTSPSDTSDVQTASISMPKGL